MKEIKFQGIDENNKIYNLIGINYSNNTGLCEVDGVIGFTWNSFKKFRQFTGLLDKNGKEIYQGDLLKFNNPDGECFFDRIAEVTVETCGYSFKPTPPLTEQEKMKYDCSIFWHDFETDVEVIGNIFENPELFN